ncbi:hypothetical protein FNV43_RR16263 [Rhamnella rubrinervis]|uniref:Vps41 beta-propeller domain-containing protein n=1 Tax=Rhamnella rubrinervis TaxID=2594499 RepID=A0A8K0GV20_9ROSA|nr:hypothetical protein FNV43_RR16263 [Rhamnella rubrinervis]
MSPSPYEIVLASSPDGPIIAYDASSGAVLTHFSDSRSPRRGLALAGKTFIAASHISPTTGSGSIHLYNWWSSTAFHNLPVPEPVAPLAATSDGSFLFGGGLSGCVYALSLPSGDVLRSFPAHRKSVSCLSISDDGSLLISGSDDGSVVVVPIFQLVGSSENDQKVEDLILHKFTAHSDSVTAIVSGTSFCNSQIISCSLDCTCKFWSLLRGTHLRTIVFQCTILGIVLDTTESELYAAGSDGSVYKIGISKRPASRGHEVIAWQQKHGGSVVSLAMVNEGRNLASASEDGRVWVWEVDGGKVVMELGIAMAASISDLVVATGISYGKEHGATGSKGSEDWRNGLCGEELVGYAVKETMEMEDVLSVGEKDRSRAIDLLESAIGMYEKLLELILKEAKRGTGSSSREKERENL